VGDRYRRFVRVYATGSIADGHLARGRLEAEGIPVLLKGESEGPYRMGPMFLFVPEELETQARLVLGAVESGAFADDAGEADEDAPDGRPGTVAPNGEPG
jgi:hypothetical protein